MVVVDQDDIRRGWGRGGVVCEIHRLVLEQPQEFGTGTLVLVDLVKYDIYRGV